jgi:hypothetical protein
VKKRLLTSAVIWTVAGLFLGISASTAAEFPYPKVEFSADMTMTLKSPGSDQTHTIQGKVFSAKGKERTDISRGGRTMTIIKDRNKDEMLTLMPGQKMYMKNQDPQARKDPETMIRDGELKLTRQGSENINGQTTTKYKIESTQKAKESFTGYAWFTKQNIPIRIKTTSTDGGGMRQDMDINYTNIVIAKQDPELFTVPGDYRELPTGMGGMGGGAQGMSPEQMKQLKEMMKNRNRQ